MISGGDGVKRTEIFTIGELYRQFEARYKDPQRTGKCGEDVKLTWARQRNFWGTTFDSYSHASRLSDGKWYTVQMMKAGKGESYYLKLYGDGSNLFSLHGFFCASRLLSGGQSTLPQLCLLKEAIDNALEAVNLSAKVYTTGLTGRATNHSLAEVTAARCADVRK